MSNYSAKIMTLCIDPFCGCGATIEAAQRLNRQWVGIDITYLAIDFIRKRLDDIFGSGVSETYDVLGEPTSLSEAMALANQSRTQFELWALGLVGARRADKKKGADRGIDGELYFHDDLDTKTKHIIFSVKSGKVSVDKLRDLRGVVDREHAQIGIMITLEKPTEPMRKEAAGAGFYESSWGKHPKIQVFTVGELLSGKKIDMPPQSGHVNVTFKKAKRHHQNSPIQEELDV